MMTRETETVFYVPHVDNVFEAAHRAMGTSALDLGLLSRFAAVID
jgi:hypothetical protein